MPTISRTTGNVTAAILALALTAGLVVRTSSAAFTATTENTGNSVEAGTVVLTDDDGTSSALLTLQNSYPGYSESSCITVQYTGSIDPIPVKVYSTSTLVNAPDTTLDFEDHIDIRIEEGPSSGDTFGDCTNFAPASVIVPTTPVATWNADRSYTDGAGVWNPGRGDVTPQERTYRVTLTVNSGLADNAYQGQTLSGIELTWETQSP